MRQETWSATSVLTLQHIKHVWGDPSLRHTSSVPTTLNNGRNKFSTKRKIRTVFSHKPTALGLCTDWQQLAWLPTAAQFSQGDDTYSCQWCICMHNIRICAALMKYRWCRIVLIINYSLSTYLLHNLFRLFLSFFSFFLENSFHSFSFSLFLGFRVSIFCT